MNVIDYIDKYGDYSFKKKPLNEIDKLIFGLLSYVHYDGTVSYNSKDKRTVKQVAREFLKKNSKSDIRCSKCFVIYNLLLPQTVQNRHPWLIEPFPNILSGNCWLIIFTKH